MSRPSSKLEKLGFILKLCKRLREVAACHPKEVIGIYVDDSAGNSRRIVERLRPCSSETLNLAPVRSYSVLLHCTSELSGHWTDGWSTDSGDGDDLNGLEEPLTDEGDSGHSDSEYDGRDGGGSYMHAAAEDHANSENVMGKQFSCLDPVIASVLLSAEFNGIGDAYA
ncbi:hypothetical protein S245_007466, partial [Arachis hypogaea]